MSHSGGFRPPLFTAILSFIGGSVLLIFAAGCNQPPLTPTESAGKDLYEIHCYECHDENDLGLKKVPPKLHDVFAHKDLPDATTPATDAAVRKVIVYGKRTMPAFNGRLSDEQIADLISYLHRK
jgi:mono/diheme cytochrome c family protein